MTGIDLDFAGIRARAEYLRQVTKSWTERAIRSICDDGIDTFVQDDHREAFVQYLCSADPQRVIAMCDLIERQAGEIARLKVEVAECKRAAVKAVVPLEAMRMAGTDKDFCPQLRDGVNDGIASVRALVTSKEDTPCRTA